MTKIDTKCVQSGYEPKNGEPRLVPVCQSTTYKYDTPEEMGDLFDLKKEGFFYTRLGNPTNEALEKRMTDLDGGAGGLALSSGMSAISAAVLNVCRSGDNIISESAIYGGTFNLFNVTLPKLGIECRFSPPTASAEETERLIDDRTRLIFCETISNPLGYVADFEKYAKICKKYGLLLYVDNSLATPVVCAPIKYGADVVLYSTTKYAEGHGTSVGGMVVDAGKFDFGKSRRYPDFVTPDESYHGTVYANGRAPFATKLRAQYMRDFGMQMSPFNAFLTFLGLDTLHLRMPRHSENALRLAEFLSESADTEWVRYCGLSTDENYPLVRKYFNADMASGMIAFGIKGGKKRAIEFQKRLGLFKIATHIADARSCVLHPAGTTHRQLSDADLKKCGITENLLRLSVGIEAAADIISDVKNALEKSRG